MIKNIVTISLTIFITIIVLILGAGVLIKQNNNSTNATQNTMLANGTTPNIVTLNQVTQHNTPNDCWLIINNKIYDVTNYINIHPGGPNQIIPYCGKDATVAFDTMGGRGSHSPGATSILANYYIGNL